MSTKFKFGKRYYESPTLLAGGGATMVTTSGRLEAGESTTEDPTDYLASQGQDMQKFHDDFNEGLEDAYREPQPDFSTQGVMEELGITGIMNAHKETLEAKEREAKEKAEIEALILQLEKDENNAAEKARSNFARTRPISTNYKGDKRDNKATRDLNVKYS